MAWAETTAITPQMLSLGGKIYATIDVSAATEDAWLTVRVGRSTDEQLTEGIAISVRRLLGGTNPAGGMIYYGRKSEAAEAAVNANSSSAQHVLSVDNTVGFHTGDHVVIQAIDDTFTRLEFHRVISVSNTQLTFEQPLLYAHTSAQADRVLNMADVLSPQILAPGAVYGVCVDYTQSLTGDPVVVQALVQINS